MKDYAVLTNDGKYTIFEFNNQRVRFVTSDKLERYTKVVEWDNGYLVVMAKYKEMPEVEEYIDLIPILNMLYYDTETFLKPIKEVAKTAAEATGGAEKVGLEEIHAYALKDATMGQYESRRSKVYEAIKGSNLTDVSHTKTEEKQNTPQKPQETPTGVSKGDIVTFTGGGVYISSTAEYAAKEKDVVSTCKVTAVNEKGTHKYHCISQDGKGVYGWVNAESIKELSSKAHSDPASVSKGDIVTFTGGGVYKSSTAEYASVQKNVTSTCKVTAVNTKGTHPYHCISQDGKGVYGWVNAADVK